MTQKTQKHRKLMHRCKLVRSIWLLPLLFSVLFSCKDDLPSNPTWFQDVQPILTAQCARCHGLVKDVRAPAEFRLDRYEEAVAHKERIFERAVNYEKTGALPMPPDAFLSNDQREILRRWIENDTPEGSRASNQLPSIEVLTPLPSSVDQELQISFRVFDLDYDAVLVSVGYREHGSGAPLTMLSLAQHGAQYQLAFDTGVVRDVSTIDVVALLDDGIARMHEVVLAANVSVDHQGKGAAPLVLWTSEGLVSKPETTVQWSATDADNDALSFSLELLQVDASNNIVEARTLAQDLLDIREYVVNTSLLLEEDAMRNPLFYQFRVTASDGKNERSAHSASFSLLSLTWEEDIRPMLMKHCGGCHNAMGITPTVEFFRVDKYDENDPVAPINNDWGVWEMSDNIYDQVITRGRMPLGASMPQDEKARLGAWIVSGLPRLP